MTALTRLSLANNQVRTIDSLSALINLTSLHLGNNEISSITGLSTLTSLRTLYLRDNRISDLEPLSDLTALERLNLCYNNITDIKRLEALENLTRLYLDRRLVKANRVLVEAVFSGVRLDLCDPRPEPTPEPELGSELLRSEPKVKRRKYIRRCGLGWSPQPQYQHRGELPKVMIYALEFEYDLESHGRYICKTIEIRTADDSIENLAGWKLYLGTRYNPSIIPITIPEEHSHITDRILRLTPEMLGLETFPCNTVFVNGISHPLLGVSYVLRTDENILVDTAYSCFVWGQNAYTTVNGVNVKSKRSISSAALREMDTPRLERYITKPNSIFITYTGIEDFGWDRVVLSDWLLPPSESSAPGAPSVIRWNLGKTWGALKQE